MKREVDELVEQQGSDSAKKPKVADESDDDEKLQPQLDDVEKLQPQLDLMPKLPATPPEVPLTEEKQAELKQKYRHSYQTIPPKVYKAKDYALWPQIPVNVFRQQVNIQSHKHAAEYMRHWFAEHEGLRMPPPKAPRASYAEYYRLKKSEMFKKNGKFSTSKDGKKIGAAWKAMSEEDKQVYHDIYDKMVAQFNTNHKFWQADSEEWGKAKQQKLKENGEETDPEKRVRLKLRGLSADDFYYYKWW